MTDPSHPLYGRRFRLVAVTGSSDVSGHAHVAYSGDVVLTIPIRATSLQPAPPDRPSSKLSLEAIRALLDLVSREDGAARSTTREDLGCSGTGSDTAPPTRRSRRRRPSPGGEP